MAEAASPTIVAVSTPPGRGGIGIVRLSGPLAPDIAARIARVRLQPRTPQLAHFWVDESPIDQGLVIWFPQPQSFTGQDVIEFQGHGSPVVLRELVRQCLHLGARAAAPGEFAKLAFLNDKIDLTQAEAIADLIDAGSTAAARAAARSLDGALSRRIQSLLTLLMELRVYCEAAIDFVDEDIEFLEQDSFSLRLDQCLNQVRNSLDAAESSRSLSEGLRVVILGRPNAGKSSLLNLLTGADRAIVTEIAGTTRDTLQERLDIDGLPMEITDTAGLNPQPDQVERLGMERALHAARNVDLILALFDDSSDSEADTRKLLLASFEDHALPADRLLLVANKIDLSGRAPGKGTNDILGISARTGAGLDALKQELKNRAHYAEQEPEFLARERHRLALRETAEHLQQARDLLSQRTAPELIAEELRYAHLALQAITGAQSADEFLGEIFGRFCIGK